MGLLRVNLPEIQVEPQSPQVIQARALLNRTGVRIMQLDGVTSIGVWSDLQAPEIRAALRTLGSERLPVRYLDGAGIPMQYKLRRVNGEPVPMSMLVEMEQQAGEPWKVRDGLPNEMGWRSKGVPWAQWKAAMLNRLFLEQGTSGQPGRITAATVRHGERKR